MSDRAQLAVPPYVQGRRVVRVNLPPMLSIGRNHLSKRSFQECVVVVVVVVVVILVVVVALFCPFAPFTR